MKIERKSGSLPKWSGHPTTDKEQGSKDPTHELLSKFSSRSQEGVEIQLNEVKLNEPPLQVENKFNVELN